jgi:hypothetical protein
MGSANAGAGASRRAVWRRRVAGFLAGYSFKSRGLSMLVIPLFARRPPPAARSGRAAGMRQFEALRYAQA